MRSTLRGPLGWALAAGLLVAACGGGGGTGASNAPKASGPRLGSFDRPISLAFTPSVQAATISTNSNAIKAALEKSTALAWKVTAMTSYAAQVEAMCSGSVDVGFFATIQMTLLVDKGCGTPFLIRIFLASSRKSRCWRDRLERSDSALSKQLSTSYSSQILVRADSGITDLNGLKGK